MIFNSLKFIFDAVKYGRAYIDVDGTILKKFPVPDYVDADRKLKWWKDNLAPTAVIRRRLPLLYLLRALGVKLIIWTNRSPQHEYVTRKALGRHANLFSLFQMYDGQKDINHPMGPVMDDQEKYINKTFNGLLVEAL
jgi:hypothetical protein